MEVLSPAGNMECLYAAIEAGCNAIYLGGKNFGARAFSTNFNNEEIVEAINYAHLYGVKIYVTVNTLIYENEVESFMEYIDFLHKNNVDAVIIQDIGMLDLIRKTYPNLEIHASTQMHIHNVEGALLMKKLGVKRIVLARETPYDLIKEIKEKVDIEIEIFVYGALCVSYSGQCLMSSLIGNRSGNRGSCVQCCRKEYDLVDTCGKKVNKDKYLLSMKDLNTLDYIKKLADIGVDSVKIEGRMKECGYVFLTTSLVNKALKDKITDNDIRDLKVTFNRKFTKGYMFNEKDVINEYRPNHLGIEIGKIKNNKILLSDDINQGDGIRVLGSDTGLILNYIYKNGKLVNKAYKGDLIEVKFNDKVNENDIVIKTLDKKLNEEISKKIKENLRKVSINIKVKAKIDSYLEIQVNNIKIKGKFKIEKSINNPITKEELMERISKIGDSIYKVENIDIICDDNIFIPIKDINEVKREMVSRLNEIQLYKKDYIKGEYNIELEDFKKIKEISILCNNKNQILFKNKTIYCDCEEEGTILRLPRVIEHHKEYSQELLVGELGSVNKYKNIITDFSLNVTNSYSVALLHNLGVKRVTLSVELDDNQIIDLINNYKKRYHKNPNLELIVYGNLEAMITKYNILDRYNINGNCYLKDNYKYLYPIRVKDNKTIIYHYEKRKYENIDKYYDMGINYLRYQILDTEDIKYVKMNLKI